MFRQEGDYWVVVYSGATARVLDTKGMRYLARLLAEPGREFHALDLVAAPGGRGAVVVLDPEAGVTTGRGGSVGPMLDEAAKAAYRRRMVELREDLDEAEGFGDSERASRARFELQMLAEQVAAAVGLGGRDRPVADAAERARVSVTKALRVAIRRIGGHHPALGSHLDHDVRTGSYCSYQPDPGSSPSWEVGPRVAPAASRLPGPPVGTSSTELVGREVELAHLWPLLKAALSGRGGLMVLAGDAGIGKTRLAAEIADRAAAHEARTALGRCPEAQDSLSLLPFVQVVETLAASMSDSELVDAAGDDAPLLAKVFPLLRRRLPDTPEACSLPPAAERQALLDGMTRFLVRAAADRGLVLILDDLQWADEGTLACLEHVAERLAELPVLVVATARSGGLEPGHPLARSRERLQRLHVWNQLRLDPLPSPAVAAMLEALADQPPSQDLTDAVLTQTAGNPFFVEELFRHLADRALLFEDQGLVSADPAAMGGAVPDTVRLVLGHRLAGLGDDARAMLDVAAVIGRSVDFSLLSDVVQLDADALVAAVEDAQHAQLLEVSTNGDGDCLCFAHDLVRHTVLQGQSLPRRRRVHARVAEALEQRVDAAEGLAADLVHHLLEARTVEPVRVIRALRRAGSQAMARAALADAHRHFDRALAYCPVADRTRAELLTERGRAASGVGTLQEALADLHEALDGFERLHEAEAAAVLALDISWLLDQLGRWHEGTAVAQRALGALADAPTRIRVQLLTRVARSAAFDGDFAASDLALGQASACGAELDDPAAAGHILEARSYAAFARFDCAEAADTGLAAARLLRVAGEEWEASLAGVLAQIGLVHTGRFADADGLTEDLVRSARRVGHHLVAQLVTRNSATLALLRAGDLAAYAVSVERYLEDCRGRGVRWLSDAETMVGMAAFWRGEWETAATHLEEGARLEPGGTNVGRNQAALLRFDAYAGRDDAVRGRWANYRAARVSGAWSSLGDRQMAVAGAEAWALVGEDAEAAALYSQITDTIAHGTLISMGDLRLLATAAGISAASAGNWQLAETHFADALAQADALPHRLEQSEARRIWAEALLHRRHPADIGRARDLLTAALGGYRHLGMPRHAALTEADLARC